MHRLLLAATLTSLTSLTSLTPITWLTRPSPAPLPSPLPSARSITEVDLFDFVWVADPQISPDGSRVAFVRVVVDEKKEGYDTSIWIVPSDGSEAARPLTGGRRDHTPRWSADGKRLAFVRSPQKD